MKEERRELPGEEEIGRAILDLLAARAGGGTISPMDVARLLAGKDPQAWSRLMPLVRRAAIRLMKEGRVEIRRRGGAVDPDDFRGTYRIGGGAGTVR